MNCLELASQANCKKFIALLPVDNLGKYRLALKIIV
jgi:hypothetical protein